MEEVLLRFHYVGQQIFEQLDNKSLVKCREVARSWQQFIDNKKLSWIRIIKKYLEGTEEHNLLQIAAKTGQAEVFEIIFDEE